MLLLPYGRTGYFFWQELISVGILDRDKQLGTVRELTNILAVKADDPAPPVGSAELIPLPWLYLEIEVSASVRSIFSTAVLISLTTSSGWETIGRWLELTSTTVAPMRFAKRRSTSGGMA